MPSPWRWSSTTSCAPRGWAREIVHAVQNARKSAGLDVSDRIELRLGGDADLLAAARAHEPYIGGETLASSVAYEADGAESTTVEGREPDRRHPVAGVSAGEGVAAVVFDLDGVIIVSELLWTEKRRSWPSSPVGAGSTRPRSGCRA